MEREAWGENTARERVSPPCDCPPSHEEPSLLPYEAGDTGLKTVRPVDPVGATEWLCLSAVLIKAKHDANAVNWVRSICPTPVFVIVLISTTDTYQTLESGL
jgi:hypothetical protein